MKKIELKAYIKECIAEVLEEDRAFEGSASNEINMLKRIDEIGPARKARQTSGVQSQDQGRDPLARKNPGLNRLAKGATDKITSFQRKSGKIASRDQRVPFKNRPRVGSVKKIGESGPARRDRRTRGYQTKDADMDPLTTPMKYRREFTGNNPKNVKQFVKKQNIQYSSKRTKGRGNIGDYTPRKVGSFKKLGEYRTNISGGRGDVPAKKYNTQPPRVGLKPRPDDSFAVKKNSPMGAIEKVKRKLRGEATKKTPYKQKPLTQKEREFMKRSYNDEDMTHRIASKDPNKNTKS